MIRAIRTDFRWLIVVQVFGMAKSLGVCLETDSRKGDAQTTDVIASSSRTAFIERNNTVVPQALFYTNTRTRKLWYQTMSLRLSPNSQNLHIKNECENSNHIDIV
jgi:hypothetical protein